MMDNMDNNKKYDQEGPQVMEWFNKEMQEKQSKNEEELTEDYRKNKRNQRKKSNTIRIKKSAMILIVVSSMTAGALITKATEGIIEHHEVSKGAKIIYENLEESRDIPNGLNIRHSDEEDSWIVRYRGEDGEKIERTDVNMDDFIRDIHASAIENGVSDEELGVALYQAGLMKSMINKTMNISEEELKEYSIKAFKENQKDMGSVNRK